MIGRQSIVRRLAARLWSADAVGYDPPIRSARSDRVIAVPFEYAATASAGRRAIMAHVFHTDLAPLFFETSLNIPGPVDVLISTDTPDKAQTIRNVFRRYTAGVVDIRIVANRGRDVAPKFVAFAKDYRRYDQVLFVHSKKSSYFDSGGRWRDVSLAALAGNSAVVRSVLSMFDSDPSLGVVFPQHFDGIRDRLAWGSNRRLAGDLCRRMGIDLGSARALDFVSGSMFWARPAALSPIIDLNLAAGDFAAEDGQVDGTLAHAIERVLLFAAESAGYSWVKVAHTKYHADANNLLNISKPGDLHRMMEKAKYRLLGWRFAHYSQKLIVAATAIKKRKAVA